MTQRSQRGVTLVELIVALVLAGVVMSGIWTAWTLMVTRSANPLVSRQQLAIAQSLLREIELQPLPGRTGFASILDYNGLVMNGITDVEGATVPGLGGYGASIGVAARALSGVPASDGWWITVDVSGPTGDTLKLASWRSKR